MRYALAIALSVFVFAGAGREAPAEERTPAGPKTSTASFQRLLDRYCVTCHNEELNTGSFRLDNVDLAQVAENGAIWEKVIQKLSVGEMPPPDKPQLSKGAHNAFLSHLVTTLDGVAAASPNPGRPGAHRLNRTEYTNAIRDLLGLEIDGSMFLSGDSPDFGFDNIADSLKLTPMMLGRYISAAARISKLAIGDINTLPSNQIYSTSKELMQDDRMGDDFAFGSRGGMSVSHHFPLDGEYILKAEIEIPNPALAPDYFQRSDAGEQLYLRLDGEQVEKFQVGLPWKFSKGYWKAKRFVSDDSVSPEEYAARERAGAFEARVAVKAGTHTITAEFLERTLAYEGLRPEHYPSYYNFDFDILQHEEPGVLTIHITGPYNVTGLGDESPSRQKIFTRYPSAPEEETEVATEILSTLARRAYRRPVTAGDMDTLLTFYNQGRDKGGFEFGIRTALEYILVDPEFLFRVETQPKGLATGDAFELNEIDLASRLSFFLWSTIPDEELLGIAERGELRNPGVLEGQVQRMLADDRSVSLVGNFATQWLYLRNMEVVAPDPMIFPEFDGELRAAMRRETELLFTSQLREDRSVPELLSANYTFLNQRLAEHYGIPGVTGSQFRRVELNDPNRGGLMGQASIWTVTSYSTRTSPVKRGKWILENLLGMPPPPPPGGIPPLPEPSKETAGMTLRQLFEEHRKAPECASCHVKMDPLGFALENFDAIGKWRTHNALGLPLDTRGSMPDGTFLEGPAGLRDVLKSMEDDFTQTAVQKLLVYALGRGLEYYDQPVVRQIMRDSKSDDYRWSSIILGIVNSTPFQMRRAN
jgi:hypothetical protein